jgi:TetR/AcrR family tetracycline transcriptional repressor
VISGADTLAEPMLRTLAIGLSMLEESGFDHERAARTLNAVVHYALGYSMTELSYRAAAIRPVLGGESELDAIVQLARALPADASPELVRVARDCCASDLNEQFEFGLQALLAGLNLACDTVTPT